MERFYMTHWLDTYYSRGNRMGTSDDIPNPKSSPADQNLSIAYGVLQASGIPNKIIPYCLAQLLHESDNFSNRISKYWNWAGIKLTKWAKDNLNAFDAGNGYAGYRNMNDFGKDYFRVLSLAPGKPINAQTAQQFLDGLIANHYFQATAQSYASALNKKLKIANTFLLKVNDPKSDISTDLVNQKKRNNDWANRNNPSGSLWEYMKAHPIITGAVLAAGGLMIVKTISK